MRKKFMVGGVFALAAVGATGCGGTKVTGDSTSKAAKTFLSQQTGSKQVDAKCPDTDYKKGGTITCDATVNNKKGKLTITMGAKDGKKVSLRVAKVTGF